MKYSGLPLVVALLCLSPLPLPAQDVPPKISVNGEAVVKVVPNKVVITFGIETWDVQIVEAKRKNNDVLQKAMKAFRELAIEADDVQTDHLSIQPRYESDYRKEGLIGHFVRNTILVTLNDAGDVEDVVTAALESGVNFIHGVDFQTTEFAIHREKARELALRAAREKAVKMAAVLGQTVGDPIQISESHSGGFGYSSSWWGWGGRNGGMSQNVMQNAPGSSSELQGGTALGKISIRAGVNVTFELDS